AGGRNPAPGGARRVGGALWRQHGAQSRRLLVRHHPEGAAGGVQGMGGDRSSSAARAASSGAGAIVVAFGFPSGRSRGGARLPRTAALSLARRLSYPHGIAGTGSLPAG